MRNMRKSRAWVWVVAGIALALVASCAPTPTAPPVSPAAQTRALIALGAQRQAQGWYEGAADAYRAALATAPTPAAKAEAAVGLARAMLALGAPERALKALRQLPAKGVPAPLVGQAWVVRAQALKALGRHAQAAEVLKRLLDRTTISPPQRLKLVKQLAEELALAGRRLKAIELILVELRQFKGPQAQALARQLVELASQAQPQQLAPFLQQAPTALARAAVMLGMAKALAHQGQTDQALELLARIEAQAEAGALAAQARAMAQELKARRQTNPRAVGVILPLSGRYGPYGSGLLGAVELGLGVVGGHGCGLELFIADSKASPQEAARAVEKLVKQKDVVGIIGPVMAAPALAAARKAQELGVVMVALAQVPGLTEAGQFVFQSSLTPREQLLAVLGKAAGEGLKRVAALAPDNSYGRGFVSLLRRLAPQMGLEVVRVVFYQPTQTDFSEQIRKLVHLPPGSYKPGAKGAPKPVIDFDALFIPDGPARLAMVLPQLAYYDVVTPRLLGTSLWHDKALLNLPERFLAGCIIPDTFDPDSPSPIVQRFVQEFSKAMGRAPNRLEAHAFDAALALKSLLCSPNPPSTRRQLREALAGLSGLEGSCGVISVDGMRQLRVRVKLLTVENGRFRPIEQ